MFCQLDIDGGERKALRDWINSEVLGKKTPLSRTNQLAIEFHQSHESYVGMNADIIGGLTELGFKLINFEANLLSNRDEAGRYQCFELLFRRAKLVCEE